MKALSNVFAIVCAAAVLTVGAAFAGPALAAQSEDLIPKPTCEEVRKADETICNNNWHNSEKKKTDWLNFQICMQNALKDYLACVAPPAL